MSCLCIQFLHRENASTPLESPFSLKNPSNPCFYSVSSPLPIISYPISRNRWYPLPPIDHEQVNGYNGCEDDDF